MTGKQVPFKVKSIFEYKSEYDDDLSFSVGKIITVDEIEDDDWYSGTLDGKSGMFPKNFVEPLDEPIVSKNADVDVEEPVVEDGDDDDDVAEEQEEVIPDPIITKAPIPSSSEEEVPKKPTETETSASKTSPVKTIAQGSQPIFPQVTTRDDPYAIKKDFIASPKSSYIPQVKPRDNSFLIGGGRNAASETSKPSEIYREHMDEDEKEEPAEEKLSLKERIALLQKRQQEEAEREAAAVKRQEERKKKMAEEKKKKLEQKGKDKLESEDDVQSIETNLTGSSKPLTANVTGEMLEGSKSADNEEMVTAAEPASEPIEEENEPEQEEEEEEEEEEVPPDDDEELRRRKLVQRMAKISGGRNMFGMMGMSPFGLMPSKTKAEEATKTEERDALPEDEPEVPEEKEEEEEEDDEEEMKPVPMLPFADPKALEKLKRASTKETLEEFKEDDSGVPRKEDPTLGEDDEPEESDINSSAPPVPIIPAISAKTAIQVDSGVDSLDEMKLNKPESDDVDDDVDADIDSDSKVVSTSAESTPAETSPVIPSVSVPPVPAAVPTPSVPTRVVPPTPPVPTSAPTPPVPTRTVPPTPPVPTRSVPPTPSAPSATHDEDDEFEDVPEMDEETSSSDEDSFQFNQPAPTTTAPPPVPGQAPLPPVPETTSQAPLPPTRGVPPVPTQAPAPPMPMTEAPLVPSHPVAPPPTAPPRVMQRSSTEVPTTGLSYNNTGSSMGSAGQLRRSSTDISRSKKDQTQADANLIQLEDEISSGVASNWWVKDLLPEYLAAKIGSELIYEVDTNTIAKRGARNKVYKDYYILFYDLSSIVFELEYDLEDPRTTIKFTNIDTKPIPIVRKDLLDKSYKEYGSRIISGLGAIKSVNGTIIDTIFSLLDNKVLPPIGSKSFGVPIYKNINNHTITKVDEPKPGDILCIKNGKFHSGFKNILIGEEEIFVSVIYEHDIKKDKFKVLEAVSGQLKKESFKMDEMKKGQLRVFRIVARDYVDW